MGEGRLCDHAIACPRHGAKFDVRTGKALTMPATENTVAHEVRVEGDNVRACEKHEHIPVCHGCVSLEAGDARKMDTADRAVDRRELKEPAMAVTEEALREQLKTVYDPELFVNIVDLGLVYRVEPQPRDDGTTDVKMEMTMTSPMCPAGPQMIGQSKLVLKQLPGVNDVERQDRPGPALVPGQDDRRSPGPIGDFLAVTRAGQGIHRSRQVVLCPLPCSAEAQLGERTSLVPSSSRAAQPWHKLTSPG